jgi:hypothetical protein
MDKITEKWKNFLEKGKSYQIYCDMDGVLVDLEAGIEEELVFADIDDDAKKQAFQVLNSGMLWQTLQKDPSFSEGTAVIFDVLSQGSHDERRKFWANMPPKQDAMNLWNIISEHNPIILSAPWKINDEIDQACVEGKREWLKKLSPPPKKIIIAGTDEGFEGDTSKHRYARDEDGDRNILIDDMPRYVEPWRKAGGIAIKHTSAENTKKQLKKELLKWQQ